MVVESALGVGATRAKLPWFRRVPVELLMEDQYSDKLVQERLVRASDLDWLIIQPVALTDGPPKLGIHISTTGDAKGSAIPRRDVGGFIAYALGTGGYIHQSVALSA